MNIIHGSKTQQSMAQQTINTYECNRFNCNAQGCMPKSERLVRLRVWKVQNGITWVDMGKHMTAIKGGPVTGNAVQKALEGDRMPVDNHAALCKAYPSLPLELLPKPENTCRTLSWVKPMQ